jgi:glucokinase
MKNHIAVVGVDIGGTKISAALFDLNGSVLQKEIRLVADRKGKQVFELLGDLILHLIGFAKNTSYNVAAVGICVPGIYDPEHKTAWAPNIPDWDNYAIWHELTQLLNDPSVKIVIESDRSCYILGEIWKGCAKACKDAIFLAIGTGIGAGILSNGRIISGNGGISGAIGWMALEPPYHKKYDNWGNFEHYASGNGIARSAIEALRKSNRTSSLLDRIPIDDLTALHVFDAYEKRDPIAIRVIEKATMYWGMALANLVSIFNPEKVIFGGGVFGPAANLLDDIMEESKKWAQPLAIQKVTLEASTLEGDAGLLGSGYLAITSIVDKLDDQ